MIFYSPSISPFSRFIPPKTITIVCNAYSIESFDLSLHSQMIKRLLTVTERFQITNIFITKYKSNAAYICAYIAYIHARKPAPKFGINSIVMHNIDSTHTPNPCVTLAIVQLVGWLVSGVRYTRSEIYALHIPAIIYLSLRLCLFRWVVCAVCVYIYLSVCLFASCFSWPAIEWVLV